MAKMVDFVKACDPVSFYFIDVTLELFGFGSMYKNRHIRMKQFFDFFSATPKLDMFLFVCH